MSKLFFKRKTFPKTMLSEYSICVGDKKLAAGFGDKEVIFPNGRYFFKVQIGSFESNELKYDGTQDGMDVIITGSMFGKFTRWWIAVFSVLLLSFMILEYVFESNLSIYFLHGFWGFILTPFLDSIIHRNKPRIMIHYHK